MKNLIKSKNLIPLIIIIFSLIGLYISFILTIDKLTILKESNKILPCTVSSTINCLSVMKSKEADVLGFPNSLLGIMGYSMTLIMGIVLIIGSIKNKAFFILAEIGVGGAFIFSYWLVYQSVFNIQILCPLCILSCISATNIFFALSIYNIKEGYLPLLKVNWERSAKNILSVYIIIIIIWYIIIVLLTYSQFGGDIIKLLNPRLYLPS